MAIVKYNPFRKLRTMQDQMNRMLDMAWNREFGEELKEGVWQPPVDIYEDEHSVIIKAEVPDVEQKDIEVKIENGTLTLRGERNTPPISARRTTTGSSAISGSFRGVFHCRRLSIRTKYRQPAIREY